MNHLRIAPVVLLAALMLGMAACAPKKEKEAPKPKVTAESMPSLGKAPAWKLKDLNGTLVTSEQFQGKVVVVDFWATWCPPCRAEIPGYTDLVRKHGKNGLVIVGVSLDQEGPEVVKAFAQKFGVNYQLVMGDENIQAIFGGMEAIPTTFLIDRMGQIRDRKQGFESTEVYEQKIVALLN